jgi:hypothetical protein
MTALTRIDRGAADGIIGPADADGPKPIRFCSRCGHPADEPPKRPQLRNRVCDRCGMGVMLSCARDALPGDAAAFLIATFDFTISAVSEAGEKIFGPEQSLVGQHALDLIGSPMGDDHLARHLAHAARRACDPVVMPVRLKSAKQARQVGTLAARIATCGPPRAALVTVEQSDFGRR